MDDMLSWLSCMELKSSERKELRDDLEHRSYQDGSILGAKSDFTIDRTDSGRI